jgi:hypothetical protein
MNIDDELVFQMRITVSYSSVFIMDSVWKILVRQQLASCFAGDEVCVSGLLGDVIRNDTKGDENEMTRDERARRVHCL